MRILSYPLAAVTFTALSGIAAAQSQSSNPACQRLEAQLTTLDRGNADPARAEQIRRAEDVVNRQQFEVDRLVAQARRIGCESSSGFFSIFSNPPAQCGGLNRQIDQQRNALERVRNDLERLNGGTTERAAQRRSLLIALGDNGCGSQYRNAALAGQQNGFWDRLFGGGGNGIVSTPLGPMGGTFRTVCVRTCDGYYFPISYSTSPDRFREDELTCQRSCPASEVSLYTYHNPGEEIAQAVSLNGRMYSELPSAFQYRKAMTPECSCRRPGESWAQTLKAGGPDDTIAPGDVVVTEQNSKQMSQPRAGPDGKPIRPDLRGTVTAAPPAASEPSAETPSPPAEPGKRSVRTVGPTFLPTR
jgi:hypothetical protein